MLVEIYLSPTKGINNPVSNVGCQHMLGSLPEWREAEASV